MPPPWDRASSNSPLLEPNAYGRAVLDLPRDAAGRSVPWPWIVVLPLIAGLSLTLWAGVGMIVGLLWGR